MLDFFNTLQDGTVLDGFFDKVGLTAGVLIILGIGILIFLIVAIIAERKTRVLFPDRKKKAGESDSFLGFDFDDDDDDDDDEEGAEED